MPRLSQNAMFQFELLELSYLWQGWGGKMAGIGWIGGGKRGER